MLAGNLLIIFITFRYVEFEIVSNNLHCALLYSLSILKGALSPYPVKRLLLLLIYVRSFRSFDFVLALCKGGVIVFNFFLLFDVSEATSITITPFDLSPRACFSKGLPCLLTICDLSSRYTLLEAYCLM